MAHTNSTPNYNLPQFLGTDKPAWLTDINNAMSDIDTAIAAAKTTADSADTAVSGLAVTVGNHTSQLSTLSGTVTSQGNTLNTVTALIGNGVPTTTDQTIIGAINELAAIVEAGEVSVIANGVKTRAQLLAELYAAIDGTKIKETSKFVYDTQTLNLHKRETGAITFSGLEISDANDHVYGVYVKLSATSYYHMSNTTTSGTTFSDTSSNVPTSGIVLKVVY